MVAFQALVTGAVRWFLDNGVGAAGVADTGGSDAARRITNWVHRRFTPRLVAGTTAWDLTALA